MSRNRLSAMRNIYQSTKINNQNLDAQGQANKAVKKNFQKSNLKVLGGFLIAFFGGIYYFFKDPTVKQTEHAKTQFKGDQEIRIQEGLKRLQKKYSNKNINEKVNLVK